GHDHRSDAHRVGQARPGREAGAGRRLVAPGAADAGTGLRDHRHPAALPADPVVLAAVVEPRAPRFRAVRGPAELRGRLLRRHLPKCRAEHDPAHRRQRGDRAAARARPRRPAGPSVRRARDRADAADHAVPDHAGRGCTAVEVHDVRPGLRHHQLRVGTLRRRRDRLGH
ncbi:MAG: Various polyols ABC transporter, permease protein 1, partial [uncultured Nocardioidaceae bacterium]